MRVVPAQLLSPTSSAPFLAAACKRLMASLDYPTTIATVAQLAVPDLADWCALDLLEADGSVHRPATAQANAAIGTSPNALSGSDARRIDVPLLVARVLASECPALLPEVGERDLVGLARHAGELATLRELQLDSAILLPLVSAEHALGVLTLAATRSRGAYAEADFEMGKELASVCSLAIARAQQFQAAGEAVELRDALLASVSHDLKSPLSTIGGHAQLLRRVNTDQAGPVAERIHQGLLRIESGVARMNAMIDELLDASQLELGQPLQLDRQRADLVELARRKVADYEQTAQGHRILLAGDTTLVGEWDAPRLERVLDNLLGNAIKYSPDGGVITVIIVADDDENGAWAVLSVRDPGVGIPESDLPHIFERFHRAGNVGRITGTGIGLAVSGHIVAQHGGTISVDSQEGAGSVFTVRLPRIAVRPEPEQE